MTLLAHIVLLAEYNAWMNGRLYEAAARLPAAEVAAPRQAFFGSLLGTLNHIAVGDTIWLQRFAGHPARFAALAPLRDWPRPAALDQVLHDGLPVLAEYRARLDATISDWVAELREEDLDHPLVYANSKGVAAARDFGGLVMHFFNHQTHHRGQATTLLAQAGEDMGVTDLLALIPDRSRR